MEGERYNNHEINLMFERIDSSLKSQDKTLERIETQTTKTNGRVNKLERNLIIVGCVAATAIVSRFPEIIEVIGKFI